MALLRAVADPTRLRALDALASAGTACHCDLEAELGATASRLSFHLRVLRDAGLVVSHRRGRRVEYHLAPDGVAALRDALPRSAHLPPAIPPDDHVPAERVDTGRAAR